MLDTESQQTKPVPAETSRALRDAVMDVSTSTTEHCRDENGPTNNAEIRAERI